MTRTENHVYDLIIHSTLSKLQQRAVLALYHYYMKALAGNVEEAYRRTYADFASTTPSVSAQLQEKLS